MAQPTWKDLLYRWASKTMLPKNTLRSSIINRCHAKHWWCLIEKLSLSLAPQPLGMLCPSSARQSLSRHKPQQASQCSPGLHLRNYPRCHLKWRILSFGNFQWTGKFSLTLLACLHPNITQCYIAVVMMKHRRPLSICIPISSNSLLIVSLGRLNK